MQRGPGHYRESPPLEKPEQLDQEMLVLWYQITLAAKASIDYQMFVDVAEVDWSVRREREAERQRAERRAKLLERYNESHLQAILYSMQCQGRQEPDEWTMHTRQQQAIAESGSLYGTPGPTQGLPPVQSTSRRRRDLVLDDAGEVLQHPRPRLSSRGPLPTWFDDRDLMSRRSRSPGEGPNTGRRSDQRHDRSGESHRRSSRRGRRR